MKLKTAAFIIGMAVALNIVACAQNSKEEVSEITEKLQGDGSDPKKTEGEDDTGGQPARVKLSGAAVKSEGGQILMPDSRITVNQVMGLNEKGEVRGLVDKDHAATLERWTKDEAINTLSSDKTYINLGCPEDAAMTKGLEKAEAETAEGILQASANTVMICGKQKIPATYIAVKAHHLILNSMDMKGSPSAVVSLSANTVTLVGKNSIQVKDYMVDEENLRQVELNAYAKLEGDGTLDITTIGADDDVIADEEAQEVEAQKAEDSHQDSAAAPEVSTDNESGGEVSSDTPQADSKAEAEANQAAAVHK